MTPQMQGRHRAARRALLLATATLLAGLAGRAGAQAPARDDYAIVTEVPREAVDRWLKDQVARGGGDWGTDRYQFVIGFSTGHYGSDPVHAIATRRLAFSLLNNSLAIGDQVTAVAWEMRLWRIGPTVTLDESPESRAEWVSSVPYAPRAGSHGGHDAERALFQVLTRVVEPAGHPHSTIVLLLTNSNQSQGPTGTHAALFGANNPHLLGAIRRLGFRPPVRQSFQERAAGRTLSIDVTALFPRKLESLPGAPSRSRYPTFAPQTWQPPADRPAASEALPNPVRTSSGAGAAGPAGGGARPHARDRAQPLLWVALLIVLALAAMYLYWRRGGPRKPVPVVEKAAPKGRPVPGVIAGTVGAAPHAAPVRLADLTTASRWRLVGSDGVPVVELDEGEPASPPLALLAVTESGALSVEAGVDTVFQDANGVKIDARNPRRIVLEPEGILVCAVASTTTARKPLRLELRHERAS